MPGLQFRFLSVSFQVSASSPNPSNLYLPRVFGLKPEGYPPRSFATKRSQADSNRSLVLYYPSSNYSNLQADQTPASPIHPSVTRTSRMIARLRSTKLLYKASFSTRYQLTVPYFSTTGADYCVSSKGTRSEAQRPRRNNSPALLL
jgi:hypothetical protein